MKNKNKLKGFTLIELLVVVAIIGILLTASQVRMVKSFNTNLIIRATNMTYSIMQVSKHLALLQNRDYIFSVYNDGNPSTTNFVYTMIEVWRTKEPRFDGKSQFTDATFKTAGDYELTNLGGALPQGACIPAVVKAVGTGTSSDPWRTLFRFYGTVFGANITTSDPRDLGWYYVTTASLYRSGQTAVAGNEASYYTVMVSGKSAMGTPALFTRGIFE